MNERYRFLREQARVRVRNVLGPLVLLILSAVLVVPLMDVVERTAEAQAQQVAIPSNTAVAALLASGTTDLSATAFNLVRVTNAGATPDINGAHGIYGWAIFNGTGSSPCYVQFFDRYPASTITVGTTLPQFALPFSNGISTGGIGTVFPNVYISPFPIYQMTSGLGLAATTTRNGNTVCIGGGGITATIFYK